MINTMRTNTKNANLDMILLEFTNSLLAVPKSALAVKLDNPDDTLSPIPEIVLETPT